MRNALLLVFGCASLAIACSSPTSPDTTTTTGSTGSTGSTGTTTSTGTNATALYSKFQSSVTVTIDGSTVVLRSNGTPDHTSPYWGSGNAMYEAPQAGMQVNPNLIVAQSFVVRVPSAPAVGTASDTPLGAIGIAVNGVALFNQYAAGRTPLTSEILSFDRFNGHPQQSGTYHYHMEPLYITSNRGSSSLIGVLLDGFPVYGPREENGSTPSGLDSCNGHTHATADIPGGIYHYHTTSATPYISGCFRGAPGTVG